MNWKIKTENYLNYAEIALVVPYKEASKASRYFENGAKPGQCKF